MDEHDQTSTVSAQEIAQYLIEGTLTSMSDEFLELDAEVRDAAYELYQKHFEMSEEEREDAARVNVALENAYVEELVVLEDD